MMKKYSFIDQLEHSGPTPGSWEERLALLPCKAELHLGRSERPERGSESLFEIGKDSMRPDNLGLCWTEATAGFLFIFRLIERLTLRESLPTHFVSKHTVGNMNPHMSADPTHSPAVLQGHKTGDENPEVLISQMNGARGSCKALITSGKSARFPLRFVTAAEGIRQILILSRNFPKDAYQGPYLAACGGFEPSSRLDQVPPLPDPLQLRIAFVALTRSTISKVSANISAFTTSANCSYHWKFESLCEPRSVPHLNSIQGSTFTVHDPGIGHEGGSPSAGYGIDPHTITTPVGLVIPNENSPEPG